MTRAEIKVLAKQQIKGNVGNLFVISFLIELITVASNAVPFIGVLIVTPAFGLSLITIYLNLTKGLKLEIGNMFSGFNDFWSAFKVQFLCGIFTFLWLLLFIIPGYIKALSYSMSMYVLAENPRMNALEAIDCSKKMMKGHKLELFILILSFIGWNLLAILTLGILYIWLLPYMQASMANFYKSLKPVEQVIEAPVI